MKSILTLLVLYIGFSLAQAQIPERIVKEWEMLTAHSGTWVADNSAYKNENETADAYAITWTYGLGKTSLRGRLFGIQDGKETPTFWEFRMYYHPEEKKLMYQQYGWGGVLGIAEMTLPDATHSSDVATFYNPDGTSYKIKHDNDTRNNTQYAQSYQWKDGVWEKQRYYEWVLKPS